jgi:hypothetical protein
MVFPMKLALIENRRAIGMLVLTATLIFAGCASYTPALVRLNPSGPDTKKAAKGSITLYAEEFVTGEKSERAFDTHMPKEGVLPILISVENNSSEAFDVKVTNIRLVSEKPLKLLPPEDAALRAQRSAGGRALGWSMIVPIITIPIAIIVSAMHTGNVNQQIVRDFTAKSLSDGAVLPNKEKLGFVFFESDADRKDVAGLTLEVTVRNTSTGEPISIELPLSETSKESLPAE